MAAFQTDHEGDVSILTISGRLEPNAWKDLKDTIEVLTKGTDARHLLIDLGALDYMGSAGFRELFLAGRSLARHGKKLAVCSLQGEVRRIFEIAKFETAYPILLTREAGLAALRE